MSRNRLMPLALLALGYAAAASAQPPAASAATSAPAAPPASAAAAPADVAPAADSGAADRGAARPAAAERSAPAVAAASKAAPGSPRGPKATDRLELGTTEISGNRELPKVLYVVPWRRPDIGDAVGRPPNSLVEEALTPVDRDVFRRQNRYYSALESGAAPPKSQPAAAGAAAPRAAP
jgi:hypothetical protein